jgi:hypothetical protein
LSPLFMWGGHSGPPPFAPKTRTAQARRPAPLVFSLYIQNIKSKGVKRNGFELYITHRINELKENHQV